MSRLSGIAKMMCAGALIWGLPGGPAWGGSAGVEVCHMPPGNPENARTITVSGSSLEAHLAHGDTEGACGATLSCPCFDRAMLDAMGTGTFGQQRWVYAEGTSGGNWVGLLIGGDGFGQVLWTPESSTCNYNDWSITQSISYEQALVCDALLNEFSLAVGAICSSAFCP